MLKFNEETHTYTLSGKELISVTQLMAKHGLGTDYSGVNQEFLKKYAERGKLIHKELEEYLLDGTIGFTEELQQFIDFENEYVLKNCVTEEIVYNYLVAGTVDLQAVYNNGTLLADFKTTSKIHTEAVRWQLSIYEYLIGKKFDTLAVIHFKDDLHFVELERIPHKEVESLFEAEANGEIYKPKLEVDSSLLEKLEVAEFELQQFELVKKELEKTAKEYREKLKNAMAYKGIKTFETDKIKMTYIAPSVRKTLNSKALKEDMPDVYNEYLKESKIKDSIRITIKENK